MGEFFRAGVGAVIRRADGRVLLFERVSLPGAWQFPQGGIEAGESTDLAVWRELGEEIGIGKSELTLRSECKDWLLYELPDESRSGKTGLGQVQRWFVFDLREDLAERPPVILSVPGEPVEFQAWRWATMRWAAENCVGFRRPVYSKLKTWLTALDKNRD